MSDFIQSIQQDLVDAARAVNVDWKVESLQESLRALRSAYVESGMPDFSVSTNRLTYALAYHPFHSMAAYEVISQAAHLLPMPVNGVFTAVSLGAGPGAEVLALVRVLAKRGGQDKIRLILVDKEPGWERTRATTLEKTARRWWAGGMELVHVTADLSTEAGRDNAVGTFAGADLIVAQAVLSEIRQSDQSVNLLADLVTGFPESALLLVCDFARMKGFSELTGELDAHSTIRTVMGTRQQYPMPLSVGAVSALFSDRDGLRQRRQVTVDARLYSRPGWRPAAIRTRDDFRPTVDQQVALDAFREFVATRSADVFVLEGPAGSGKTEIMREMAVIAAQHGVATSLHAPTGQAAVRLSKRTGITAGTIHSGLYDRSGRSDHDSEDHEWPPTILFNREQLASAGSVVLIDEASMIGDESEVDPEEPPELQFEEGHLLSDIIAGTVGAGGQVVFVGDSCQLPPFKEDEPVALIPSELEARGCRVVRHSLTSIVRTEEASEIREISDKLRQRVIAGEHGLMPITPAGDREIVTLATMHLESFLLRGLENGSAVALAMRNRDVAKWNEDIRAQLGRSGRLPIATDRLVMTKGSVNHGLLNGTELRVMRLVGAPVSISVTVKDRVQKHLTLSVELQSVVLSVGTPSGDSIEFEATIVIDILEAPDKSTLSGIRRALWVDFLMRARRAGVSAKSAEFWAMFETDERVNAIHASYSYARTLFRAQGGEWDSVIIDGQSLLPERAHTARQAYSAVTRAKNALYLRNWFGLPRRRTLEELVEGPSLLLRQALGRPTRHQRINEKNPTLEVQIITDDQFPPLRVNLFEKAVGDVSFSIQPGRGFDDDISGLRAKLEYWKQEENSRGAAAAPVPLSTGMRIVEDTLHHMGIDFYLQPSGSNQIEVRALRGGHEWAYLRLTYRNTGEVTRMWMQDGSEALLLEVQRAIRSQWPLIPT